MASIDPEQDGKSKTDPRLDSLDMQLREVRRADAIRSQATQGDTAKGMRQGNRVLTELIAGPAGGALVGWFFDRLFGTSPWILLTAMFLGIVVAFRNIIRISNERPD